MVRTDANAQKIDKFFSPVSEVGATSALKLPKPSRESPAQSRTLKV